VQRGQIKRLHPTLSIGRVDMSGAGKRFFACLHFKTGGWGRGTYKGKMLNLPSRMSIGETCAYAKSPKRAVSAMFRKVSSTVAARSSAFAAFAGYSRKNRAIRRRSRSSKRRG
jgi:hypothetical protein